MLFNYQWSNKLSLSQICMQSLLGTSIWFVKKCHLSVGWTMRFVRTKPLTWFHVFWDSFFFSINFFTLKIFSIHILWTCDICCPHSLFSDIDKTTLHLSKNCNHNLLLEFDLTVWPSWWFSFCFDIWIGKNSIPCIFLVISSFVETVILTSFFFFF